MNTRWCTEVSAIKPSWLHTCNKRKCMRTKNIKIYSLNSDNHTELLYLYKVYCAKKQIHFKEEDFVASHRQLEKIKQCLGGTHFTFCYGFGKTVERKTKVETNVGSSPSTCSSVTAADSFFHHSILQN